MTGASQARRLTLTLGALGITALLASPAVAQTELIPDETILENPIKKVKKIVNKVAEEANEVVDETQETVDETVDETQETVDETKREVVRVVERLVGPPAEPKPARPNERRRPTPNEPRRQVDIPARVRGEEWDRSDETGAGESRSRARLETRFDLRPVQAAAETQDPVIAASPTPSEIARRLTFPLLMTALVVAFLVLQGRFDRRDPKLAFHLDLDGERLSFE